MTEVLRELNAEEKDAFTPQSELTELQRAEINLAVGGYVTSLLKDGETLRYGHLLVQLDDGTQARSSYGFAVGAGISDSIETGTWTPEIDATKNPGGALLEVFFAKRYPDGTPLSPEEMMSLGSRLVGAIQDDPAFWARYKAEQQI